MRIRPGRRRVELLQRKSYLQRSLPCNAPQYNPLTEAGHALGRKIANFCHAGARFWSGDRSCTKGQYLCIEIGAAMYGYSPVSRAKDTAKRRIGVMLTMEQGTKEKWSIGEEEPRDGTVGSSYRFGASKYVIARRGNGTLEPLHAALPSGGEALPVFVAEQAAWRYLRSETPGTRWYVRETHNGELASMLMSLCSGVGGVLVDPDPVTPTSAGSGALVDRESLLDACLGAGFAPGGCRR